jgi:small subunit ribosomal protein S3
MSHTVHPYSHRLGIIRDWKSRWFGGKRYKEFLKGDTLLRTYLEKRLRGFFVSLIEIERSEKAIKIIIETSRPGMIIGRNGEGAVKLKADITKELQKRDLLGKEEIKVDIKEIRNPESNSMIVGQMIAEGLEKRMPFRRVMKQALDKIMANKDVQGAKILLSGILGGSTMARVESLKRGRIPLQTLRADIDYALFEARLPLGTVGVKIWIYKGEVFKKKD